MLVYAAGQAAESHLKGVSTGGELTAFDVLRKDFICQ
ncbi:hypothetical protein EHW99_1778 [Erwinia amylovora]|uniref:Uncharacterized protein n=1 Tax=Erwinia amylovora (strain CFBP1430) TaxID=665029 RepID=D4I2Q0_ERWAC|nr:hypothetical protein EaACW_1813 [Erwinia amylovora ACW56400]QJQ54482.1 hypothetical protein EHX00_1778 [Erwinia amylovora]CBA20756.1 hypothetical protein predicted by Glimmer/Critica [Erwinia amylovora CFBP1430]CCO78660.1 hypothetical protein BN432_1862 [Erwinia amylovora Ea356]CCO99138.1 hypothetical protein BN438_1856 [Erwinia amylovora UPN527]